MSSEPDFGILLVHGIGNQTKGDTLTRFGNPLIEILKSEIPGQVALKETSLKPENEPSHARLTVAEQEWVLAEAHWAEEFKAPTFGELLGWIFNTLPGMITLHVGEQLRRSWQLHLRGDGWLAFWSGGIGTVWGYLKLLVAYIAFVLLSPVLLILSLVALVPVPSVREFVMAVIHVLTSHIGDSFALIRLPLQSNAIISKVRKQYCWLKREMKCKKMAIVAHSQGASIAQRMLIDAEFHGEKAPEALITFGSGIKKLSDLETEKGALKSGRAAYHLFLFGAASFLGFYLTNDAALATFFYASFLIGTAIVTFSGVLMAFEREFPLVEQVKKLKKMGVDWHDFYASSDPVSNGPIFDGEELFETTDNNEVIGKKKRHRFWHVIPLIAGISIFVMMAKLNMFSILIETRSAASLEFFSAFFPLFIGMLLTFMGIFGALSPRNQAAAIDNAYEAISESIKKNANKKEIMNVKITINSQNYSEYPAKEYSLLVHNRRNPITDHTSYLDNRDQFVMRVAHILQKTSGIRPSLPTDTWDEITGRRKTKTVILAISRSGAMLMTLLFLISRANEIIQATETFLQANFGFIFETPKAPLTPDYDYFFQGLILAAAPLVAYKIFSFFYMRS